MGNHVYRITFATTGDAERASHRLREYGWRARWNGAYAVETQHRKPWAFDGLPGYVSHRRECPCVFDDSQPFNGDRTQSDLYVGRVFVLPGQVRTFEVAWVNWPCEVSEPDRQAMIHTRQDAHAPYEMWSVPLGRATFLDGRGVLGA